MATVTVQDLLEAGVHFGHQTRKWNPKMKKFVYGEKNGIYIIDLAQTMKQIFEACNFLQHVVADGGNVLFVGTKRQAQEVIKEAAEKTAMFHVTERWLGGTLTNNATIQKSIRKMKEMDEIIASPEKSALMKKKELVNMARNSQKLHKNLDGIASMKKLPAVLFVVDVCSEDIAIKEAVKLKIPVVAIVDTNGSPDNIAYPIVANDDALKSIKVITTVITEAINDSAEIYRRKVEEDKLKASEKGEDKDDDANNQKRPKKPSLRKRTRKTDEDRRDVKTSSAASKPKSKSNTNDKAIDSTEQKKDKKVAEADKAKNVEPKKTETKKAE